MPLIQIVTLKAVARIIKNMELLKSKVQWASIIKHYRLYRFVADHLDSYSEPIGLSTLLTLSKIIICSHVSCILNRCPRKSTVPQSSNVVVHEVNLSTVLIPERNVIAQRWTIYLKIIRYLIQARTLFCLIENQLLVPKVWPLSHFLSISNKMRITFFCIFIHNT